MLPSCLPRMYRGICSIGPGRYSEIPAIRSSKQSGRSCIMNCFMPPDSSWNTASVSPEAIMSQTPLSSKSFLEKSGTGLPSDRMNASASRMIVSVRSPRKSIFKRPSSSSVVIGNCVVSAPSLLVSGTTVDSGTPEITTPAACVELCRGSPSSFMDRSSTRRMVSSPS